MRFDPIRAAVRFGTGLSPKQPPPRDVDQIIAWARADEIATQFPLPDVRSEGPELPSFLALRKQHRTNRRAKDTSAAAKAVEADLKALNVKMRDQYFQGLRHTVARAMFSPHGLTERLVWFWADHFSAHAKENVYKQLNADYLERAIRPHVLGTFGDMLAAAITHPLMVHYLDQSKSVGPNSEIGQKNAKRGLNENLAREVLELHTLGVDGPYAQDDVLGLAYLLTGLTEKMGRGSYWHAKMAEPGAHAVLGKAYTRTNLQDLQAIAQDLALHPTTARHLARKMVVHFVSDRPDSALVDHLAAAYLNSGGNLGQMTEAMLHHPAAWDTSHSNVKWPMEYVASSLRVFAFPPRLMERMNWNVTRRIIAEPLLIMGQNWMEAAGPDGVPEADDRWITPQGLAARLEWGLKAPSRILKRLPVPREFLDDALGPLAPQSLRFAVESASQRQEALALILASPAFQRR